ncbi:hypothetical protein DW837_19985 [Phocaeicola vulgatus]|nr:hypothetical protein DW837_19985 [Phocaeicola vulgatus]
MKKTTTILCLGIALCMLGCSDDDDQVTTTSTVPFSLTASLSPRSSDAEDTGILQGNWDANSQLAVIKTGSSGVPKSILTRKTDSSDTFTGNLSTLVKNENEIAVFYPAAAITANSSDTLTQTLNLSGQDGTLAGITNYDYLWAQCKAGMNETTGSSACEMTSLVTIGKFQFTVNGGSPLNNITRITITATAGTLYSSAVMKLKNGEFSSTQTGNITILKSATKLFSVLLASKRPLITELADKLRLKYPLLPTISPCPTMRLEAIRSIIPISCRRYPKSV